MFFTLSLGFGALIAFASYMPIHNQVMRDAYTVVFVNCGTSLFAGIVVFSILGYREHITGIPVTEVRILPWKLLSRHPGLLSGHLLRSSTLSNLIQIIIESYFSPTGWIRSRPCIHDIFWCHSTNGRLSTLGHSFLPDVDSPWNWQWVWNPGSSHWAIDGVKDLP